MSENEHENFIHKMDASAILTVIGIILLFSTSIIVILIAPSYVDSTWTQPTSYYQVQMYEVADPNLYISNVTTVGSVLQFVNHLKKDYTLLAFKESENVRIIAPPELEKYITRLNEPILKLTSLLLLLREPENAPDESEFQAKAAADTMQQQLQDQWEKDNPDWREKGLVKIDYDILELYDPKITEAFSVAVPDLIVENWVDENYKILDDDIKQTWHQDPGVIYVNNPREYRISPYRFGTTKGWRYDPRGKPVPNLQQLQDAPLGFRSRKELIELGEHIFAIEGCWYCHTDQTRTLVQDVVLNGSDSYPAPPSSANEYIYQKITFPGTKRNGPDLSRVGIKRPSRDWHKSHFWSPKTESRGSIMPAFKHFFDDDPRGTSETHIGIPNYRFEGIFQYLMTKGTRITPPTQAWWVGKDPIHTIDIIEGRVRLAK
jgi:cytochrome c oxidase cbb3-type subunit 2